MALYGRNKDALLIQGLNRELLHNIIEQQVGYYKPVLEDTPANIYGEAQNKTWLGPVLLKCLLDRGEQEVVNDDFGVDRNRTLSARFFRYDLVEQNVVPEIGDVILWNENYCFVFRCLPLYSFLFVEIVDYLFLICHDSKKLA